MTETMDQNRFGARVRRYAQVGTSVGGLAAQFAANRFLGINLDSDKHSANLKMALGDLKGPLMKAAQLLAHIPEALPKEYADQLRQLQSNAPAMGWSFVKRRMRAELGPNWQDNFEAFPRDAAAAASLGQVHKAILTDGTTVACKLQYPDMSSAVEADMRQLQMAFGLYAMADKAVDPSAVYDEIGARLREELDYEREAANLRTYAGLLADEPCVHIPEVVEIFSTKRLLTMQWLDGRPILDFLADKPSQEQRNQVALNMFRAWYVPFYSGGIIHGDPHMGNYSLRDDLSINLLDFGCVRIFSARFVSGVIDLYHAIKQGDESLAVEAYKKWGFKDLNTDLIYVLNMWARFIMGPILTDGVGSLTKTNSGAEGARVAKNVHQELKKVGGVKLPPEFVFMDRAAVGLGSVFLHLDAQLNWSDVFLNLIKDFDEKHLAERQTEVFSTLGLPNLNETGSVGGFTIKRR